MSHRPIPKRTSVLNRITATLTALALGVQSLFAMPLDCDCCHRFSSPKPSDAVSDGSVACAAGQTTPPSSEARIDRSGVTTCCSARQDGPQSPPPLNTDGDQETLSDDVCNCGSDDGRSPPMQSAPQRAPGDDIRLAATAQGLLGLVRADCEPDSLRTFGIQPALRLPPTQILYCIWRI